MVEYFDFGSNLNGMVEALEEHQENDFSEPSDSTHSPVRQHRRPPIDSTFFEVRKSICVAGFYRDAVRDVKNKIASILDKPCPIESFHVNKLGDIKDGALLVPKIVLVGVHCPGRKLLDDEGNRGQLDFLYDEACDVGADVMVVYIDLPRAIYTPVKHAIYHPKVEEMVFPSQPLLRHLANENCFLTVCENSDLSSIQTNVLKEWVSRPVGKDHPVFQAADYLSSVEMSYSDLESSEATSLKSNKHKMTWDDHQAAEEEHPLADKKKKKKRRKAFGFKNPKRKEVKPGYAKLHDTLGTLEEASLEEDNSIELNIYRTTEHAMETGGAVMF